MSEFERFVANLEELIAGQPHKQVGDATIGYWMAIHAIRNAARCASDPGMNDKTYELGNGSYVRLGTDGGITMYNDDNIVVLSARQTDSLRDALLDFVAAGAPK